MMAKVNIEGLPESKAKLRELIRANEQQSKRIVEGGLKEMKENVKFRMATSPASGRRYGQHTASSAGNAPRPESTNLINSVKVDNERHVFGILSSESSELIAQALTLEFGDRSGRLGARPAFAPAFNEIAPKVRDRLIKSLRAKAKSIGT